MKYLLDRSSQTHEIAISTRVDELGKLRAEVEQLRRGPAEPRYEELRRNFLESERRYNRYQQDMKKMTVFEFVCWKGGRKPDGVIGGYDAETGR